jgi:hypothetical protein
VQSAFFHKVVVLLSMLFVLLPPREAALLLLLGEIINKSCYCCSVKISVGLLPARAWQ